jgi:hypothetical protein
MGKVANVPIALEKENPHDLRGPCGMIVRTWRVSPSSVGYGLIFPYCHHHIGCLVTSAGAPLPH